MCKFIIVLAIVAGSLFVASPAHAYVPRDPTLEVVKVCHKVIVFEHGIRVKRVCHREHRLVFPTPCVPTAGHFCPF